MVSSAAVLTACAHHRPQTAARPAPAVAQAGGPAEPHADTVGGPAPEAGDHPVTHAEVTQQALTVFGDTSGTTASVDSTRDTTSTAATENVAPTWDIDVRSYATQARVAHFVARFTGEARDLFTLWVERGTRYEPLIRAKLRAAGLPEDMAYLPIIESGYSPQAYSRAAAVGLWQLMTSTAQGAGLRVDWWVDERRDPVRSTDAAIRFLKYLKDQFGSIYLAAAAYDGGPGRISRGLARYADDFEGTTGDDLFFALADKKYLRVETKDYVPQLIAAALVAKEPARYGLQIKPQPAYAYDSVRVGPGTPLASIARAAGTTTSIIADLNPQILRGMTPPRDSFLVRIPEGQGLTFDSAFADLDSTARRGYRIVVSKKGDSFATIARHADLTITHLKWYNHNVHPLPSGRLPIGTSVMVPRPAVVSAALEVPDPAIERYGSGREIHIVHAGESLSRIAAHYHTSVATLMRLNGLRKSTILPGQALVISGAPRVHHRHRSA